MSVPRVLVVEDDARLRSTLLRALRAGAFEVDAVADGASALARLDSDSGYSVIVLDVGLPDSDGRDVCQAIRSRGIDVPVLFLTARGQTGDQLSAFAAGGDDFLPKPFDVDVLLARLRSLARRAGPGRGDRPAPLLMLDPGTHTLVVGIRVVPLTPTEYRILGRLLASAALVLRRRELIGAAWPPGAVVSDNTLDQYIGRIRRKLAQSKAPARVATVHGVGYRLDLADTA